MPSVCAFSPCETYDCQHASDGESRYGVYLAQYADRFTADGAPMTDPAGFAAAAWRIAVEPVMCPGYVRAHGRVLGGRVCWDDEGRPAFRVELAVSSAPEAACLVRPWRRWTRDAQGRWVGPDNYARPNALTVLDAAVPLAGALLPTPRYHGGIPDTTIAKRAVQAVCATVNAALAHVLAFDPITGGTP